MKITAAVRNLEIKQRILDGPNSSVFLATDRETHRQLALKEIPMDHPDAKQELLVAQRLRATDGAHAHVVAYEAAFVEGDSLFLVMEAYPRGDLHTVLEHLPGQRMHEHDAMRLWRQIVAGVACLHDHGIAHRDLSLENVLLDDHDNAKVCDFGLSTFSRRDQLSVGCVGKPYYMAPEIMVGSPYDAMRADVWSLGIVLFVLLTGSPLVQSASPSDPSFRALARIGVSGILKHWCMDREVSAPVVTLLDRLLQATPSDRPANARDLLNDL